MNEPPEPVGPSTGSQSDQNQTDPFPDEAHEDLSTEEFYERLEAKVGDALVSE